VSLIQTYKDKLSTLPSYVTGATVYDVLLEMVSPYGLYWLMVADMGADILRSISHIHNVDLKLSLFSSWDHGNQDSKANLYILYVRTIREEVPLGIYKVAV